MRWKTARARQRRRRPDVPLKTLPAAYAPLLGVSGRYWRILRGDPVTGEPSWYYLLRGECANPGHEATAEAIHDELMTWKPPTIAELRQLALAVEGDRTSHLLASGSEVVEDDVEGALWARRQEETL